MHNYIVCQVFRDSLKQHIIFKGIMFVDFVVHSYPRIQIPKKIQQSYEAFYIEMQQTRYQQNYFPMNQLNLDNPGTLNTTYKNHSIVLNDIIWCKGWEKQNYFPMNQLNLDNPGTLNTTYKNHSIVLNDIIWCKLCGKLAKISLFTFSYLHFWLLA